MFWMFLINALGVLIGFGLAFYLLLITQKGGCSDLKPELLALVFFVRFLAQFLPGVNRIIVRFSHQLGVKANDCSLSLPGRFLVAGQKSRRFLRLFALWPSLFLASAAATGLGAELLFGFPPRRTSSWQLSHIDLVESANYCSVSPGSTSGSGSESVSVSGFGVGVRCRNDCPAASFSVIFCRFS